MEPLNPTSPTPPQHAATNAAAALPPPPAHPYLPPLDAAPPGGFGFPPPEFAPAGDAAAVLTEAEQLTPFKRFWRRYGGDAFVISVGLHIVLAIIALTWVTSQFIISANKPEDFVTGAGGGNQGDKVNMSEHRVNPKNARNMVKTQVKLVSKSSSGVSLPDMPNFNAAALTSGSLAGATSKGLGGGAGGGIGSGIGPGRGGGRSMVSLFGVTGFNAPGLVGTLYDIKKLKNGSASPAAPQSGIGFYKGVASQFINSGWKESVLSSKYWASPTKLTLQQVLMPLRHGNAVEAPKSFEAPQMDASRWIVHYRGTVKAPFTGKMRFVGMADDWIVVRWQGRNVLVAGYGNSTIGSYGVPTRKGGKPAPPPPGVGQTWPYLNRPPMQSGAWLTVTKGNEYPIEIAMGETPGGEFCAVLAFQKDDAKSPLHLFRMNSGDLPKMVTDGSKGEIPKNVDNSGGGFIWEPKMPRINR